MLSEPSWRKRAKSALEDDEGGGLFNAMMFTLWRYCEDRPGQQTKKMASLTRIAEAIHDVDCKCQSMDAAACECTCKGDTRKERP